jgi:uncharacterized protein involved in response to NO
MQAAPGFPEASSLRRWLARYLTSMTKLDQSDSNRSAGVRRDAISRRLVAGNVVFFPMATAYAIFVLPASVFAMLGLTGALPALASTTGHAHEMLFGFALAVIVGNQIGPVSRLRLALLTGLWVIARATFLCAPQSIVAAAANIAFAALLVMQFAPRLLGAAKKWRNQALPLVLTAICVSSIAFQLARQAGFAGAEHTILDVAVLLFALLLLFMGGRLIGPTIAGEFFRQGGKLDARVQPRIEGGLIIVMAVAVAALLFASFRPLALLAAAATTVGTLTLNVMAMTWTLKARQDPSRATVRVAATILVGGAALARVLAGLGVLDPQVLFVMASMLWSSAFALLLALLVRLRDLRPAGVHARAADHGG